MAVKNSACMYGAIQQLCREFKGSVHSITCDRGSEFVNTYYVDLLERQQLTVYMAHPYSPHERGANENHNGLLREYFPKGTDFSQVSSQQLNAATEAINNRPRKILNWQTANQRFVIESFKRNQ